MSGTVNAAMRPLEFLLVILAMIAATWLVAWWGVAAVAAVWALARRRERALALKAGLAGALSWIAILVVALGMNATGRAAEVVGTAMGVGATALILLVLAYPALLASSAAALTRAALTLLFDDRHTRDGAHTGSRASAYRPARPVDR